jgi:glycerate kinase
MRIVVAPNAFKETLSAAQATGILCRVFQAELPGCECRGIPVADGGDGTLDALLTACGGMRKVTPVMGPLGEPVMAAWACLDDGYTAVIEMAEASGLAQIPHAARNPLRTTSHGTGELVRRALDAGARTIVLGIGGSATVDGGLGLLQALGMVCLDARGQQLTHPLTGADLGSVARLNLDTLDARLAGVRWRIACDVDALLTGARGAAAVFGPQKGATPAMVEMLEAGLANLAAIFAGIAGRDVAQIPGAGAAGGVGAALMAVLGATLEPGTRIIFETSGLPAAIAAADLVVTGEGRLDASTLFGKAPAQVADLARAHGVPVVAFCGQQDPAAAGVLASRFDAVIETASPDIHWDLVRANAGPALAEAAVRFCHAGLRALPIAPRR